jgi:uncharacterized protein YjlB
MEREVEKVISHELRDDGVFPNNSTHPVLLYRGAFDFGNGSDPAQHVERVFANNGWSGSWRAGVHDFDHYHSTAHEVLGCYQGRAQVRLGGPSGVVIQIGRGDVLVIPAGVAHRRLEATDDFRVVGAYAGGRSYDMNRGRPGERPDADSNIADVPRPDRDPVEGEDGPLLRRWT